jgi:O-antigen/teichoic acid export membrane protein
VTKPASNAKAPFAGGRLKMVQDLLALWSGHLITKGVNLAAFAFLARQLDANAYGAVEYAMGLATLAALAVDGGIGAIGVRRLAQGSDTARKLAAVIPMAQFILALIIAPGVWLFAAQFSNSPQATALVGWVALSLLILPWQQSWLFQATDHMQLTVVAQAVRVLIFTIGAFAAIRGTVDYQWVGILEAASVAGATLYLMFMQRRRKLAPLTVRFQPREMATLIKEGAPIGGGAILWAATQYVPMMMLAAMVGIGETGYFGAANRLVTSLMTFSWLYHFNLYPTIARHTSQDPERLTHLARASFRVAAWGGVGMALGITLLAQPILTILYGPRFEASTDLLAVLIWSLPALLLAGHARWMLVAAHHEKLVFVAELGAGVTITAGGVLLIGHYGALGAAITIVAGSCATWAACHFFAIKRTVGVPFAPCIAPILLAGAIIAADRTLNLNHWLSTVLGCALYMALGLLIDRKLIGDLVHLAAAKRDSGLPEPTPSPVV